MFWVNKLNGEEITHFTRVQVGGQSEPKVGIQI